MTSPDPRQWFELTPGATVTPLGAPIPAPKPAVGLGFARGLAPAETSPTQSSEAWWRNALQHGHCLDRFELGKDSDFGIELAWFRDSERAALVVGRAGATIVPAGDFIDLEDGRFVLGARGQRATCRATSDDTDLGLLFEGGELSAFALKETLPSWVTDRAPPSTPVAYPVPVDVFLEGWPHEPWLGELVRELASSEGVLSAATAAGAVLRVWHAPAEALDATLRRVRDGEKCPPDRVRDWVARAPTEWVQELRGALLRAIGRLQDEIQEAELDEHAAARLRSIVMRRDDLESMFAILLEADAAAGIRPALEALDTLALARLDLETDDELEHEPRISAVSWMDPSAWWGAFARP